MIKSIFDTVLIFMLLLSPAGYSKPPVSPKEAYKIVSQKFSISQESLDFIKRNQESKEVIPVKIPDPQDPSKELELGVEKADIKVLHEFMPSRLYENLSTESAKAMALAAASPVIKPVKNFAVGAKDVVTHTTKQFPVESAIFFIAIGAVMTAQLAYWYSENPVALEQHIASLQDPVSHVGFYAFMLANGTVNKSLSAFASSTRMRHFIPYLGMTAGMLSSSIVGELLGDPDFQKCVAHRLQKPRSVFGYQISGNAPKYKKENEVICDLVYKKWVLTRKLLQYAPGLISMLASTAVGGAFEWGIHCLRGPCKGAILAKGASRGVTGLIFRGLAVGISFIPGVGWSFRGGQVLYKIANMAGFTILDQWIFHPIIKWPFGNGVDSERPSRNANIVALSVLQLKKKNWVENSKNFCKEKVENSCEISLPEALDEFHENMARWREFNLEHAMMKHHHWSQMLSNLTGKYVSSEKFYNAFIAANEIRLQKNPKRPNAVHPLERTYPLWGMSLVGGELNEPALFAIPEVIEDDIIDNTIPVVVKFIDLVADYDSESAREVKGEAFIKDLVAARNLLVAPRSQLHTTVVEGILKLNKLVNAPNVSSTSAMAIEIKKYLKKLIGNPNPLMIPGVGYIAAYEAQPINQKLHSTISYPNSINGFKAPNPTDHFVYNMVCGLDPDKNGQLITRFARGFSWEFSSPRIAKKLSPGPQSFFCDAIGGSHPRGNFYDREFVNEEQGKKVTYQGLLDYLKKNLDPRFVDKTQPTETNESISNAVAFQSWWLNFVQPQLKSKVTEMSKMYESEIVPEFLETLRSAPNSRWNATGLDNAVLKSMKQELKFYVIVLGEMVKDLYTAQYGGTPNYLYSAKLTAPVGDSIDVRTGIGKILFPKSTIFDTIAEISGRDSFNFNAMMKNNRVWKSKFVKDDGSDLPLEFQVTLLAQFDQMVKLFEQFDVQDVGGGHKRLSSKVGQKDFEAESLMAEAILDDLLKFLIYDEELLRLMLLKQEMDAADMRAGGDLDLNTRAQLEKMAQIAKEKKEQEKGENPEEEKEVASTLAPIPDQAKIQHLQLTIYQMKIVESLQQKINTIFSELKTYGQIINAVNYEKMQKAEKAVAGTCSPQSIMSNPTLMAACRKTSAQLFYEEAKHGN